MLLELTRKKEELEILRPLNRESLRSLREKIFLDWTYNSNAIEGNTLTLIETKVVLEGITIGGKTVREHLEALNHREAIICLEEIVQREEQLTEWQIKEIHSIVLKGIDFENAGHYRECSVMISGAVHTPPHPMLLKEKMQEFIEWYNEVGIYLHPVVRAALVHVKFVGIHPFIDGNGRTSRLLLNLELMKSGYPPIVIKKEKRAEYYAALDKAHTTEDADDFINLISLEVNEMLDLYLNFCN